MLLPAASAPLSVVVNENAAAADAVPTMRSDVAIVKEVHATWLPDVEIVPAKMMLAEHEFCVTLTTDNVSDTAKGALLRVRTLSGAFCALADSCLGPE